MSYEVYTTKTVEKAIARLPGDAHDRMNEAIDALADDPRPPGCKNLGGGDGYRIRVGEWRALYRVNDRERRVDVVESRTGATSTAAEAPSAHRPGPIGHENNQSLTYAEPQPPLSPT